MARNNIEVLPRANHHGNRYHIILTPLTGVINPLTLALRRHSLRDRDCIIGRCYPAFKGWRLAGLTQAAASEIEVAPDVRVFTVDSTRHARTPV